MNAISMVDLDRTLSMSVARARHRPLLVKNRHKPWVWLVSHETWWRERQYLEYISDTHPLMILRGRLDRLLQDSHRADTLTQLAAQLNLKIDPQVLCRALCLQAAHAIQSIQMLYENIGYNMAYRHFVGVDTCVALWAYAEFEHEVRQIAGCHLVADLIDFAVAQSTAMPRAEGEFRSPGGYDHTVQAGVSISEDCDCGLKCLPPRVR
ncbi:transposase [Bordetella ansorpii]|nr:transposase [Bordetella ansorpii]